MSKRDSCGCWVAVASAYCANPIVARPGPCTPPRVLWESPAISMGGGRFPGHGRYLARQLPDVLTQLGGRRLDEEAAQVGLAPSPERAAPQRAGLPPEVGLVV